MIRVSSAQLTFDTLLADAATVNQAQRHAREFGHLPLTMEEALPFFRDLIERHHAAMIAGDIGAIMRLRKEAHDLAYKLNGFDPGILADENAPGYGLARLTRAKAGKVPLWGQTGSVEVRHKTMRVRIEMEGLFGIGASHMAWLGFAAHAMEKGKPFLSETGYRSFLGVGGGLAPGYTPETFALGIVETHVQKALKGKLVRIVPATTRYAACSSDDKL